jgi:RNA polymerase sigma factor (sigma-70 family)
MNESNWGFVVDVEGQTDRELLRSFARCRDESAFAILVHRHGPLVLGICRHVLNHLQDAEDAVQATFLVLARKAGEIDWHETISSWLCEVATRVALEARGKQNRFRVKERSLSPHLDVIAPSDPTTPDLALALDRELGRLPEKYRVPLLMCLCEGRSRREAAELLGVSEGAVKGRLERGRDLLRKKLTRFDEVTQWDADGKVSSASLWLAG